MAYYTPDTTKVIVRNARRFLLECGDFKKAEEWASKQGKSEKYRANIKLAIRLLKNFLDDKPIHRFVRYWYDGLMEEFRAYLRTRGHKGKTLSTYPYQAGYFIRWLGAKSEEDLRIGSVEANKFMIHLAARGLSNSGMASYLDALRAFYDFLIATGRAESNPFREIPRPKRERKQVRFLTREEIERLLEAAKQLGFHRYLAIRTLYVTGMRLGELLDLRWGDVDLNRRRALVRGKTGERYVLLDKETARLLLEWKRQTPWKEKTARVFIIQNPGTFRDWLRKAARIAGLGHVTPHMLRHSFATHLIQAGVHERIVQALLGHASIQSTMVYTHVRDEDLRKAHNKLFSD